MSQKYNKHIKTENEGTVQEQRPGSIINLLTVASIQRVPSPCSTPPKWTMARAHRILQSIKNAMHISKMEHHKLIN